MDKYELFYKELEQAVARFKTWDKNKEVKIVSHLDADGISASAIIVHVMNQQNRRYTISILPQLDNEKLSEMKDDVNYIFTDLGSGQLEGIKEFLGDRQVIILDHHEPVKVDLPDNIVHVNPHLLGIDGSKEVSGAGVVYLFARALDLKNQELAHIAIIGAIGDVQEDGEFLPINKEILKTAIEQGKISTKHGLRFFGRQTRPIHKILEYSSDPFIPGVAGSETKAIQFLQQLGIDPKKGNSWKKIGDLTDEEKQRLTAGVIMRRVGEDKPEDVLGTIYTLPSEKQGSPTRDAREFATLLNACGRMERASAGIGACLGIEKDKQMALQTLADYKKEIVRAMNWYRDNQDMVIKGKNYLIINAKDQVLATIIGTLASIMSKSNDIEPGTYIMSMARSKHNYIKVSLRISSRDKEVDLRGIVKEITDKVGGEAGGHMFAAGALVPLDKEEEFLKVAKEVLEKQKI